MYEVISFEQDETYVDMYITFVYNLYKDDEKWIPPTKQDLKNLLHGRHACSKFLSQKNFIIIKDNQVIGGLIAFVNSKMTIEGSDLGTVGCFECIDDIEASRKLLNEAVAWLKEQGVKVVWGPMNGTMWMQYRLMTKGFDDKAFYGEPYNKEYYLKLFEDSGFEVIKHWQSTFSKRTWKMPLLKSKIQPRYENVSQQGYSFRKLDINNFNNELRKLCDLINDSFSGFLGYHEIDSDTFIELYKGLRFVCDPNLIVFAVNPQGEEVGFIVCLPDFSNILRRYSNKNLGLLEKIHILVLKKFIKNYIFLYMGVTQKNTIPKGVGGALLYKVGKKVFLKGRGLSIGALISDTAFSMRYTEGQYDYTHEYVLLSKTIE